MPPATILCIDDEPDGLRVRCKLLEKAGYRVVVAASPLDGVRLFAGEQIDLVVLDYWMPDIKGIAAAERLKRMNPSVPIIMLSAFPPIGDETVGRVERWLIKGESGPEDLLSAVQELLDSVRSQKPRRRA
jgi:CheY-like chemotaxis protein